MLPYERNGYEQVFVEKVEKCGEFSTGGIHKTQVIHKVIHIIHRKRKRNLWKKQEQMCFMWISEKPEFSRIFKLRKNFGSE